MKMAILKKFPGCCVSFPNQPQPLTQSHFTDKKASTQSDYLMYKTYMVNERQSQD